MPTPYYKDTKHSFVKLYKNSSVLLKAQFFKFVIYNSYLVAVKNSRQITDKE